MQARSRRGLPLLLLPWLLGCRPVLLEGRDGADLAMSMEADGAPAPMDARVVVDAAVPEDLAAPAMDLSAPCPSGPRDCSPGPGSGEPDTCKRLTSCFFPAVRDAVTQVIADHPTWFDDSGGSPIVLKVEEYMNAVVAGVNAKGLCAIRDPNAGDEVAVKHDNGFAESFDILAAAGNARWGAGIYTATCAPAWF